MNYFFKKVNPNQVQSFNSGLMRKLVVCVVLLLSNGVILGQVEVYSADENRLSKIVMPSQIVETYSDDANEIAESKMDLVFWLMGLKQSQIYDGINNANKEEISSTSSSEKKRFNDAGVSSKGVLYRTFFKKILNYRCTIT